MKIIIDNSKKLTRLKDEFNQFFPFLTLEFFENDHSVKVINLNGTTIAKFRRNPEVEILTIFPEMTVGDLEKILLEHFGIPAQVLRKSGNVWLKPSFSVSWSLQQQNEQGKIVSAHLDRHEKDKDKK